MDDPDALAGLAGNWTHSYEEDHDDVHVYRPSASFPFPPSRRGRHMLEFTGTKQVRTGGPGPDDRPRLVPGTMTSLGANRYRLGDETLTVVEYQPGVLLKIRRT